MRRVLDFFRMVIISWEFAWLLLIVLIFQRKDLWLVFVGRNLLGNSDVTTWMPAIPTALCGTTFFLVFKLLAPSAANNKLLYEWPDYWRLEWRRNLGVAWCVVSVMLVVTAWIFRAELSLRWIGGLFLASLGLALISSGSMLLGACKLKVTLESNA
jgi:hypothetical protein